VAYKLVMLCGSSVVYLKMSPCLSWHWFHAWCTGHTPMLPWQACQRAWGSMHQPYRHSRARDKKLVGGGGAIFAAEGGAVGLCQSVLARVELAVGLAQRQWVHSVSYAAGMA
jgi:hypothetical protein